MFLFQVKNKESAQKSPEAGGSLFVAPAYQKVDDALRKVYQMNKNGIFKDLQIVTSVMPGKTMNEFNKSVASVAGPVGPKVKDGIYAAIRVNSKNDFIDAEKGLDNVTKSPLWNKVKAQFKEAIEKEGYVVTDISKKPYIGNYDFVIFTFKPKD